MAKKADEAMNTKAASNTRRLAVAGLAMQIFALAVLACVRSDKLIILAYDLPESPVTEQFIAGAERWNGLMEAAGVAAVTQDFVEAINWLRGGENGL